MGRPVEPEVNVNTATSSPLTASTRSVFVDDGDFDDFDFDDFDDDFDDDDGSSGVSV